jgi:hypothetical protein
MSGQDSLFPEYDRERLDEQAERAANLARQQAAESAERIRRAVEQRDGLVAHKGSTGTQRAGAKAARPRSGTKRGKVYEAIASMGEMGVTDADLELLLMERHPHEVWSYSLIGPRRRELVDMGLVEDSGQRRRVGSGSEQIMWRVAP